LKYLVILGLKYLVLLFVEVAKTCGGFVEVGSTILTKTLLEPQKFSSYNIFLYIVSSLGPLTCNLPFKTKILKPTQKYWKMFVKKKKSMMVSYRKTRLQLFIKSI